MAQDLLDLDDAGAEVGDAERCPALVHELALEYDRFPDELVRFERNVRNIPATCGDGRDVLLETGDREHLRNAAAAVGPVRFAAPVPVGIGAELRATHGDRRRRVGRGRDADVAPAPKRELAVVSGPRVEQLP